MRAYAAAGCLLLLSTVAASDGPQTRASDRSLLVLTISAPSSSFVLYEPVAIRCHVDNPTAQTIQAIVNEEIGSAGVEFAITGPDGTTWKYRPSELPADRTVVDAFQAPGSVADFDAELSWNAATGDWTFPGPGKYHIAARMGVGVDPEPIRIDSAELEIEITAPLEVDEKLMASFPTRETFLSLLRHGTSAYCRGTAGPACFEELDRIIWRNKRSAYAPGLEWNLAESVASGLLLVTPRESTAIELLGHFLKQWPSNPNAPRVMYRLAMLLDQAGRHRDAADVIQTFERKYPDRKGLLEHLKNNLVGAKRSASS